MDRYQKSESSEPVEIEETFAFVAGEHSLGEMSLQGTTHKVDSNMCDLV